MSVNDPHACLFDWCTTELGGANEHWWLQYVYASLRRGNPSLLSEGQTAHTVGIGVIYDEGEVPAIVVHIDGGPRDDDLDAHLKIVEAVELRDLLDRSITAAREALTHMVDDVAGAE